MPEYTKDEALAFIEAMRLTLDGKVGFKWLVEKLSGLAAYVESTAAQNERLSAYIDEMDATGAGGREASARRILDTPPSSGLTRQRGSLPGQDPSPREESEMKYGARNAIAARVTSIQKGDVVSLVKFDVTLPATMASVLTTESVDDMELAVGDEVHLVVKAVNVLPIKD